MNPVLPGIFSPQIEDLTPQTARFYGPELSQADVDRLTDQMKAIYSVIRDGHWRTLREIGDATGFGEASISAQLRNMRKPEHGSLRIDKQNRGGGLWAYRLVRGNNS